LNTLIERAATNNHDLKIAAARLNEARALRRGALWAFAPQGGVTGAFERGNLAGSVGSTWSSGFDATWEIDVFGRLRHGAAAATAEVGSAQADLRNVQVALLAEVAANYFSLRGAQEGKALLEQQRELLKRSLATTQTRVAAGRGSQLDVARAESLLKETEAALPPAEREEREHLHRLAVLLGEQPGSFGIKPASKSAPAAGRELSIGTPAELLRRRPDVAGAERQLAAATAIVGVHTAEMFPEVSISGFIRFLGGDRPTAGAATSQPWAIAPRATWHILSLGRLNANRRASQFRVEGVLAAYDRTVLKALEDVENALVRYRTAEERLDLLGQRESAAERAFRIAQAQYEAGVISSLEATDAERTALAAARETLNAATEQRLAIVALNKALGGGWEDQSLFAAK
jgi:multidrug efflux system outer membrane protein